MTVKVMEQPVKQRTFYALMPWRCEHIGRRSEISAYVEASGTWETIGVICPTSGATAEMVASFITNLINDNQRSKDVLRDAMEALEAVMRDGLNFSTEQAADCALKRIKTRILQA